jgi:hypothetical protein
MKATKIKVDWPALRQEYIGDPASTYRSLASKHRISFKTISWHGRKERWRMERANYSDRVGEKLVTKTVSRSVETIAGINQRHLQRSAELRAMLNDRLKTRTPDGKVIPRPGLSIRDLARAIVGFGLLYRLDRIALGVVDSEMPQPRNRLLEMSDDELLEELKQVRARNLIN